MNPDLLGARMSSSFPTNRRIAYMRKIWLGSATAAIMVVSPLLLAADHLDGPAASADPAADITDVFAWMSSDAKTAYMIMNVVPLATTSSKFSTAVQYVFHTT